MGFLNISFNMAIDDLVLVRKDYIKPHRQNLSTISAHLTTPEVQKTLQSFESITIAGSNICKRKKNILAFPRQLLVIERTEVTNEKINGMKTYTTECPTTSCVSLFLRILKEEERRRVQLLIFEPASKDEDLRYLSFN